MNETSCRGRVLRFASDFFYVLEGDRLVTCKARGKLKKLRMNSDIIAIGDFVEFEMLPDGTGIITDVLPRTSEWVRMMTGTKVPYRQVLIANLDQVLIVFAAADPEPRLRMLDRFLVICERQHIHPLIVINKMDLVDEAATKERFSVYSRLGYEILFTSARDAAAGAALKSRIIGKISGLLGPSGVGKSTLLNCIDDTLDLKTGEISEWNKKGRHTTVVREMFPLKEGGFIADLPGIKTLGLWDIEPEELDGYFPEIRPLVSECFYSDCTHDESEVDCAVRAAVEAGTIDAERYTSYLRMRFGDEEEL